MTETSTGIARRTLAKGAAWAVPTVAVAAAAPVYAASGITTLPPCIAEVGTTGGTYPVTYTLSNCSAIDSHWDFQFKITAKTAVGTDCSECQYLRITLYDNPNRSRLWIVGTPAQNTIMGGDPSTNTGNYNRLYVQKVLAAGATDTFPELGDDVYRVAGPADVNGRYTGFLTPGSSVGPIETHGDSNDTLHVLVLPNGGIPCSATGPMAYYRVECGPSANGPWTQKGGIGQLDPCVPMIQATVCRFSTAGNGRYRLQISVLNPCGILPTNFKITNIQRNSNSNSPNGGNSVWSPTPPSTGQALNAGVTNISMSSDGNNGTHLWISFTTDNGLNTSQIRVPTNNASCPAGLTSETSTTTVAETSAAKVEETTTTTAAATTTTTAAATTTTTVEA